MRTSRARKLLWWLVLGVPLAAFSVWAIVDNPPEPATGELSHWVLKDDPKRRMTVVPPRTRGAQHARLSYSTLGKEKLGTLVEVTTAVDQRPNSSPSMPP